jgi:hypothetical protein
MSCAARLGRGSSGLHGISEENATVAKDFKVFYEKGPDRRQLWVAGGMWLWPRRGNTGLSVLRPRL